MTSKPPVQKPPVRTATPPVAPGIPGYMPPAYAPPPPPAYVPPSPVYLPPPPPEGAPMTGFLSVLGWISVIWLVGILILGFSLRAASSSGYGASVASVSMWLSVAMGVVGLLSGLLAIFELGRETTGDAPKPTMFRLCSAVTLLVFGVAGQACFSTYLTASDANSLITRLDGVWERLEGDTSGNQGPWNHADHGMKTEVSDPFAPGFAGKMSDPQGTHAGLPSSALPTDILDFTQKGLVIHEHVDPNSRQMVTEQEKYQATGATSFTIKPNGTFGTFEFNVEFVSSEEMIVTKSTWYNSTTLTGRWRRISGGAPVAMTGNFAEMMPRLRGQLRGFHIQKRRLADLLTKLDVRRKELIAAIDREGVNGAATLVSATAVAKQYSEELVSLVRNIKKVEAKHDDCAASIVRIESALRQVDIQVDLQKADVKDLAEVTELLEQLGVRLEQGSGNDAIDAINDQILLEEQLGK